MNNHCAGYDEFANPTIANSFATAAFRFGHTLIQGTMRLKNADYETTNVVPISTVSVQSYLRCKYRSRYNMEK
jgi:hypothetical protein